MTILVHTALLNTKYHLQIIYSQKQLYSNKRVNINLPSETTLFLFLWVEVEGIEKYVCIVCM